MQLKMDIKDPISRMYIRSIFEHTPAGYLATTRSITGSVICALATISSRPDNHIDNETTVTFVLPDSHINSRFRSKFLRVSPSDAEKINLVLHREFQLTFMQYCYEGKIAGYKHKDIISKFMSDFDLGEYPTAFETLTKRRQRIAKYAERNFRSKLSKSVHNKSFFVKKRIFDTVNS